MTIPEWVAIILASIVCAVIGWGVKRLVKTNDETSQVLTKISDTLSSMNGRMVASETWQQSHEKYDDERHQEMQRTLDALWGAVRS